MTYKIILPLISRNAFADTNSNDSETETMANSKAINDKGGLQLCCIWLHECCNVDRCIWKKEKKPARSTLSRIVLTFKVNKKIFMAISLSVTAAVKRWAVRYTSSEISFTRAYILYRFIQWFKFSINATVFNNDIVV